MIAIYLRLSMTDGDLGDNMRDESNSIENQRLLLQSFIMERDDLAEEALTEDHTHYDNASIDRAGNILNILEYVDDGYSGTGFERPSFRRMIEDCRQGIVTTIIVKDISRFGRNYIGVGDYIDRLFPLLGVRFISANNNYDSNDYVGEPMGFDLEVNNLISTFYSRDLSKKIKSTKENRWKRGISTSAYAPFGYRKGDKGKFIIDPEAADTVRFIFSLACQAMKPTQIAHELNDKGIQTPGMYNRKEHIWPDTIRTKESEQLWTGAKVCHILNRYEYTGALVAGKRDVVKIGSRHMRQKDRRDWVVIDDVNPAIVSKEDFEAASGVVRSSKSPDYMIRRNYALKGKVKCGNCGRMLAYDDVSYERKYYCAHGLAAGKYSKCNKEKIPAMKVEGTVRYSVWNLCRMILDAKEKAVIPERVEDSGTVKIDRQMKIVKEERMQKYELYANGGLSREEYIRQKKELTEQIQNLQAEKEKIEAEAAVRARADTERQEFDGLCEKAEAYLEEDDFSAEMVEDMVKEVRVFDGKRIEVELNYTDVVERYAVGNISMGS